jgi:hypothetical protein
MTNPYLPPEIPQNANLPEAPQSADRHPIVWLPIAVIIAVVIGLGYYYFGQTISPSMRAADAMMKFEPIHN